MLKLPLFRLIIETCLPLSVTTATHQLPSAHIFVYANNHHIAARKGEKENKMMKEKNGNRKRSSGSNRQGRQKLVKIGIPKNITKTSLS
jgi:hypothetical protein